ncbi:MAG: M23 family metallopeptidase [Wenzhouxiangellaceae bacterium]
MMLPGQICRSGLQQLRHLLLWPLLLLAPLTSATELIELLTTPVQGALVIARTDPAASVALDGSHLPVTADGRFVFGFGRDANRQSLLHARTPDGREQSLLIQPAARQYAVERIDGLPPATVTPPPELSARISREAALVAAARRNTRRSDDWAMPFIWPAKGRISGVYGSQRVLNGEPRRPHFGVDVAAPVGTEVVAPAAGMVVLAEADLYYSGGTVIIDHGDGVTSTFLHLHAVEVSPGQQLDQGTRIGSIGATGRATGPHLDWRMNWRDQRVDPRLLLKPESWQQAP